MPTYEQELLRSARNLARLQTQRRRLKRQLKACEKDIRAERKNLSALANRNTDPDIIPSRVFGDGVGHKWRDADQPLARAADAGSPIAPDPLLTDDAQDDDAKK